MTTQENEISKRVPKIEDTFVGALIRDHREDWGISQEGLATEMRKAGFKWAQATVWSVESGTRPLRIPEAQAVASILLFDPAEFFGHIPAQVQTSDAERVLETMTDALLAYWESQPGGSVRRTAKVK